MFLYDKSLEIYAMEKFTRSNICFLAYFLKGFSEKGRGPFNDRREAFRRPRKTRNNNQRRFRFDGAGESNFRARQYFTHY